MTAHTPEDFNSYCECCGEDKFAWQVDYIDGYLLCDSCAEELIPPPIDNDKVTQAVYNYLVDTLADYGVIVK